MQIFRKILCVCLSVCFAFSCVTLFANAADVPENVSLAQFLSDTTALLPAQTQPAVSDGVQAAAEAQPTRLIVRARRAFDDCGAVAKSGPFDGISVLQYADEAATLHARAALQNDRAVEWVCRDAVVHTAGNAVAEAYAGITADGSKHFSWGADYMGVDDYCETVGSDGAQVTVAVLDTGVDTDHELFCGFYDADSNPDGRLLEGISIIPDTTIEDENGHGTHTAGTVADIAPAYVKILPVKVLDMFGGGYNSTIMLGVLYAAQYGADIISMSLDGGVDTESMLLDYCITYAMAQGALCVVAAGNESDDTASVSPAHNDQCLVVAAVNQSLEFSYFSNYGDEVDVCAPGENVLSACLGGGYIRMDGTSMATPHVAAVAAVYKAQDPSLSPAALEQKVKDTATPLGAEGYYGSGLVALRADGKPTAALTVQQDEVFNDDEELVSATFTFSAGEGTQIYYTTDGTVPTEDSTPYTAPVTVRNSCRIRAIGYTQSGEKTLPYSRYPTSFRADDRAVYTLLTDGDTLTGILGNPGGEFALPNGITKIGAFALHGIPWVDVTNTQAVESVGVCGLFDFAGVADLSALRTADHCAFAGTILSTGDLPALESVGNSAFLNCNLGTLNAPKLKYIGDCAFMGNWIHTLSIPSVITIGAHAFDGAIDEYDANGKYHPFKLDLPQAETIGDFAFFGGFDWLGAFPCPVKSICAPKVKTIGDYAFFDAESLQSMDLPCVQTIGDYAFDYAAVESLSLPEVRTLGVYALGDLGELKTLSLPKLQKMDACALFACGCDTLDLPQLEEVGAYGFTLSHASTVSVPKLREIGDYAFSDFYTPPQELSVPAAEHVGTCFAGNVKRVIVPASLQQIDVGAFERTGIVLYENGAPARDFCEKYDITCAEIGTLYTVRFFGSNGKLIQETQVPAGYDAAFPAKSKCAVPFRVLWDWVDESTGFVHFADRGSIECVTRDMDLRAEYISVFKWIRLSLSNLKESLWMFLLQLMFPAYFMF